MTKYNTFAITLTVWLISRFAPLNASPASYDFLAISFNTYFSDLTMVTFVPI